VYAGDWGVVSGGLRASVKPLVGDMDGERHMRVSLGGGRQRVCWCCVVA